MVAKNKLKMNKPFAIAIHGGAGNLVKLNLSPEQQTRYKEKLLEAVNMGYAILKSGGSSLDAVEACVRILEDSPLFNAGKGAVFSHEGHNELDAAIMDGSTLKAGAVAQIRTVKNPITAARKVMEKGDYVLLSGVGADEFAKAQGCEVVDSSYFFEQYRWDQLLKVRDSSRVKADSSNTGMIDPWIESEEKYGTVGAVALDMNGNLAAATSTGGTVNKRYNRIGDTPLIGAGTYANNSTCAVSCTGRGEEFIRLVAGKDISDMVEYSGKSAAHAGDVFIHEKLVKIGGRGGVIIVDKKGDVSMFFNTTGMYRAYIGKDGIPHVAIYKDGLD
jgi:beta-aspartyl-peptidase (threonine type)